MITIQQAAEIFIAGSVALGAIGTLVEFVGNATKSPSVVALGKKLEALGADLPKLLGKRSPDPALLTPPASAGER